MNFKIIKEIGMIMPNEVYRQIKKDINAFLKKHEKEFDHYNDIWSYSIEDIIKKTHNIYSLGINITESCNLSCSYCIYSGCYNNYRKKSDKFLDKKKLSEIIEFIKRIISSKYRKTKTNEFVISLYGGEPLLNFGLLFSYIEEIENELKTFTKVLFKMTTNGTTLNNKVIDYLVKKNIALSVSLDGDKKNHDIHRKFVNGKGSFDLILSNLRTIYKKYPSYFEKINILCVISAQTNQKEIFEYFDGSLFKKLNVIYSLVEDMFIKEECLSLPVFGQVNIGDNLFKKVFLPMIVKRITSINKINHFRFTSMCFPGAIRPFVDCNGDIHICEKIHDKFSIGTVYDGFNIKRIHNLLNQWRREVFEAKCYNCDVFFLCSKCFVNSNDGSRLIIKDCKKERERIYFFINKYIELLEEYHDEQ